MGVNSPHLFLMPEEQRKLTPQEAQSIKLAAEHHLNSLKQLSLYCTARGWDLTLFLYRATISPRQPQRRIVRDSGYQSLMDQLRDCRDPDYL